jgi:hypothetical protein
VLALLFVLAAREPEERLAALRAAPERTATLAEVEEAGREADALPAGLVRAEWRVLLGEACIGRARAPEHARTYLLPVALGEGGDAVLSERAVGLLLEADLASGAFGLAEDDVRRFGVEGARAARVHRLVRRHRLTVSAWAASALPLLGLALSARRRALRHALRAAGRLVPLAAGFAAVVAMGGSAFVLTSDENASALPFVALGAVAFGLVLVARAWGASGGPFPRWARAGLCVVATAAVAFLVLATADARYLESFGL